MPACKNVMSRLTETPRTNPKQTNSKTICLTNSFFRIHEAKNLSKVMTTMSGRFDSLFWAGIFENVVVFVRSVVVPAWRGASLRLSNGIGYPVTCQSH